MDESTHLAPRDRWSSGPLEPVRVESQVPFWDMLPREPHLLDYWRVLRKHQWLILFFLLTVVTIITITTFRMQPVYQATARIEIGKENTNILPFQGVDAYDIYLDLENNIETQAKILQSETMALQTITSTGVANHPEFGGSGKGDKSAIIPRSPANQERPPALTAFLSRLSVKRVPNSRLLDVTLEASDPKLAARVLNAHLENFI